MNRDSRRPKVTVVTPVYNVERYLRRSLDSILYQEFTDFEVIAIDDGSTDKSLEILRQYAANDSRVRVVTQKHQELVATLNKGISLARGEYIARMDSDDYSMPLRFERQVDILNSNPGVVVVGGSFELIDEEDAYLQREAIPFLPRDLKRRLLLRNPFAHGSTMFRKSAVEKVGGYSNQVGPTEDLDLWIKLSDFGDFEAINRIVYRWRVNLAGISSTRNKEQQKQRNRLLKEHLSRHIGDLEVLSWSELRKTGRAYFKSNQVLGVHIKKSFLTDNAQLAFKLIGNGHLFKGIRQLMNVALTGRTGLLLVTKKVLSFNIGGLSRHEDTFNT